LKTKPVITSSSNLLVKQARALRQRKARVETGLFLVEGIHHVGEALQAAWPLQSILYAPDLLASDFGRELIARAEKAGVPVQPVSKPVMESLAGKDNPSGLLAIARQGTAELETLAVTGAAVALVAPQDPGNLGAVLRSLDAVDAGVLFLLDGGVDPYHPTAVRASMGALFWKPVVQSTWANFLDWARRSGRQLIGTSARAGTDYREFMPVPPWILVLGSEQKGLSAEQLQACAAGVRLPMRGRVSSLNLAVAAGILLYQFAAKK
jgi:TrmH family RNA methyltransferase